MTGITDFDVIETMPNAATDKYAALVPAELAVLWTDYGLGTFRDGYLRVVNPDDWMRLVRDTHRSFNPLIPIAPVELITALMGPLDRFVSDS
ncbi:hypothetical protein GCM10027405_26300 [Arthrobacter alkaliphilus]|uniref:GAD-like domain-containing protein n=1 Tax=Arthrobacter alkaliphilus TaxID=369936 RepID=UPI001F206B2F|nr:GAD-like domain-containing protein [Arthrobacter alkaliphilus]